MDSPLKDRSALLRMAGNIAPAVFAAVLAEKENGTKDLRDSDIAFVAFVSVELALKTRDLVDEKLSDPKKEDGDGTD